MRTFALNNSEKIILSIEDISKLFSISRESAKVTANRYVQGKQLIRLKRNFYITPGKFEKLKEEDYFRVANMLQVPSYVSLTSALSYYNISTQQVRSLVESIALKRTKNVIAGNVEFKFLLIKKNLYTDFILEKQFFIAIPEKALADAVYLTSLGKYNCDFDAIDFGKLNKQKVNQIIELTNNKTKSFWKNLCKRYKI
jgi:predicted transcriptional regulator of viral defense system